MAHEPAQLRSDEELRRMTVGERRPHEAPITLVASDPAWADVFAREAERIRAALGGRALLVEHVGSTSVPGLVAKPIIDVLLAVADSADEAAYVPDLERAGYRLRIREPDWLEHRMLDGSGPAAHVHVFTAGEPEIARMLRFRDRLRTDAADRDRYAAVKLELARRRWRHVQHYADAKSGVIDDILGPPDAVGDYLAELTQRLRRRLGGRLVAAWIAGSGALGDFDPARSDVDVQAVATTRLGRAELEALASALSHESLACPARGLEFVLFAREDLTDPAGPAFQLNLNTGPGMQHHEGYDPAAEPRFWFTLDVAIARRQSRPLAGPAPSEVLPELSRTLVLSALREALAWYHCHDPAGAVLAACRAWAWAADGRWRSKGEAAAWAAERLGDPGPVVRALAHRADPAAPEPTPADVATLLEVVEPLLAGAG